MKFIPICYWPWYLRWTAGTLVLLCVVIPGCVLGAVCEGICDGIASYWRSDAWTTIKTVFVAVVLGDLKD